MRFTTTAGELRDTLAAAREAIVANPAIHALAGVRLRVTGSTLTAVGSDGELTIEATQPCSDSVDGEILLPPAPIATWVAALDATRVVTVAADDARGDVVATAAGLAPYRFRPMLATHPGTPSPGVEPQPVDFSAFADAVAAVRASSRGSTAGALVRSDGTTLSLWSTDNYRMHVATLPGAGFGEFSGVVAMAVLERAARYNIDAVAADPTARVICFAGPGVEITARLLALPWPASDALVAVDDLPATATVPRAETAAALGRLAAVAAGASTVVAPSVAVAVDGATMALSVSSTEIGSGTETVAIPEAATAPIAFHADRRYLADAIACHAAATVTVRFVDPAKRVLLTSETPELSVTAVVMPVAH